MTWSTRLSAGDMCLLQLVRARADCYLQPIVVAAALQVDPDRRYASATVFKDALNQFFHESGFIFSAATLASFLKGLFPPEDAKPAAKKTTITCIKGKLSKKVTAVSPKCPAGYKKK